MITEIPRFRYSDDVLRFLSRLSKDVAELGAVCDLHHKAALKALTNAELGDVKAKHAAKTMQAVKRLDDLYNAVHTLTDFRRAVDSCETTVSLMFASQQRRITPECTKLRSSIDAIQVRILEDLNALGKCPQFAAYLDKLKAQVATILKCADMQTYSYVHAQNGALCYVYYLVLIDVKNAMQRRAPYLYISMRWTPGRSFVIDVNHEFEVPTRLLVSDAGTSCKPADAFATIQALLTKEQFS